MQTELTGGEKFWYYFACVCTCGGLYFVKIAAKKALCEVNAAELAAKYRNAQ